ncbi:MAG: hypothetical protein BroJett038_22270 [Chloroflexota bacterium]|nr:MAG: hypothetical protein BroJett038_22270 [Chloroflexota bacterium]
MGAARDGQVSQQRQRLAAADAFHLAVRFDAGRAKQAKIQARHNPIQVVTGQRWGAELRASPYGITKLRFETLFETPADTAVRRPAGTVKT